MSIGATAARRYGSLRNGASELAADVAKKGGAELHDFFDDVQDLLAKVTDLDDREVAALRKRVQASLETARESAQDGARRVRDTAASWRDSAGDIAESATEMAMEHARSVQREIRKRPVTIALAVAVIGVALGALLARERSQE